MHVDYKYLFQSILMMKKLLDMGALQKFWPWAPLTLY